MGNKKTDSQDIKSPVQNWTVKGAMLRRASYVLCDIQIPDEP